MGTVGMGHHRRGHAQVRRQRDRGVHRRVRHARRGAEEQPIQLGLEVRVPGEDALFVDPAQRDVLFFAPMLCGSPRPLALSMVSLAPHSQARAFLTNLRTALRHMV